MLAFNIHRLTKVTEQRLKYESLIHATSLQYHFENEKQSFLLDVIKSIPMPSPRLYFTYPKSLSSIKQIISACFSSLALLRSAVTSISSKRLGHSSFNIILNVSLRTLHCICNFVSLSQFAIGSFNYFAISNITFSKTSFSHSWTTKSLHVRDCGAPVKETGDSEPFKSRIREKYRSQCSWDFRGEDRDRSQGYWRKRW